MDITIEQKHWSYELIYLELVKADRSGDVQDEADRTW